jgi:hypothetical protein
MTDNIAWKGGKCMVPMWTGGLPNGYCERPAYGPQLPFEVLWSERSMSKDRVPYCHGPCCPAHGGPAEGEPIVFRDGLTKEGRSMYCAVMPDFVNLQESPAGFSGDGRVAVKNLKAEIAKEFRHD